MKFILIALAAAGIIGSATALLADTPVTPAEEEKIKAALEDLGCTGGKIEKETEALATLKSMTRSAGMGNATSSSTRTSR